MGIILNLLVNTVAILVAAYILPDVRIESLGVAIVVAIVLGVLNTFVKPILKILTFPITIITLGLFLFVINTALVLAVAYLVPGFEITTLLSAFLFSVIVSFVSSFLSKLS